MNILIIGSTGMLGSTLKQYFNSIKYNVKEFNRASLDLSKCSFEELQTRLETTINESNIQLIINCSGAIKQRKEFDVTDMIKINSIIPHWLSKISKKNSVKFIHFTTDCVYDGVKGNYTELDSHNARDSYGLTKSLGEPEDCTLIRTSIIGEEKANKLSLLEWIRSNKGGEINGYKNHMWSGVTCLQMAKIIEKIIKENLFWEGVRHLHSNEVNKFDLACMINEIYDLHIKINPLNTDIPVNRSLLSIKNNEEFHIPSLYKQIQETRDFHENIKNKELGDYYTDIL